MILFPTESNLQRLPSSPPDQKSCVHLNSEQEDDLQDPPLLSSTDPGAAHRALTALCGHSVHRVKLLTKKNELDNLKY